MIVEAGHSEPVTLIKPADTLIKASEGVHYVKYKKWWDTLSINQAGRGWQEDKFYCPFPEESMAYDEFWDEQEHYVRNGYKHEGELVPGLEYLYLNYCPIWLKKLKKWDLPDFRVVDLEWFDEIEKAMALGPYQNAEWKDSRPAVHITSKTRQSGHSLKGVVPVLFNMHFVPGSRNFIGAYQKVQAQKTNKMFQHYRDHLFIYTAWGKRWLRTEADEEYLTGYQTLVKGQWVDDGFLSYLKMVGFADGFPEKAVGGGVDLFVLEEIGVFPGLIAAVNFLSPSVRDGDITTGTILGFGAAGSLAKSKDLQELSYNPEANDCWTYDNIWAKNPEDRNKKVVYFIPNYSCRPPHIDKDGNPNPETAIVAKEKSLALLKKSNYESYMEKLSQSPNTMEEMFAIRQKTRFSAQILEPHLRFLEAHRGELSHFVELFMDYETDKVKYRFVTERMPIWDYPIDLKKMTPEQRKGVVEIFEFPVFSPPRGLYIAAIDSYNQQDTTSGDSLGCIHIYKRQTSISGEETGRVLVAEYYARPDDKQEFYRTCLYLQLLFNAIALPENEDQELVPWYFNKGFEHMLADQPDLIRSYLPNSTVKRTKGIHAQWILIKAAENKIQRYLEEVIGMYHNAEGEVTGPKHGVTRIPSLGLTRELIRYVSDEELNFDRVRTFGWLLMYEEETFLDKPQDTNTTNAAAAFLTNTQRFSDASNALLPPGPAGSVIMNKPSSTF